MTLHTSTQIIEKTYTVEGPDSHGRYSVTGPRGLSSAWQAPGQFISPEYNEAVQQHIASLPKPPTISATWDALIAAKQVVGDVGSPDTELTHNHTPLTKDEAITLMDLLKKITKEND